MTRRVYEQARASWGDHEWGTRTLVMGIVNATPDSFSSDGTGGDVGRAVSQAVAMLEAGADIVDIGGESTRPGAGRVDAATQIARVVPVIEALRRERDCLISVDTTLAPVASAALSAGATIVNDVSGTEDDPDIARVAGDQGAPYVVMHNQRGRPHTDVIADITDGLRNAVSRLREAGVTEVIIDPGFGFGWSVQQNLEMLRRLDELWALELPILVGTSRKSTIGAVLGDRPADQRLMGTAATVAQSICAGADIVRVHDVPEMVDVVRVTDAIVRR